MRNALLLALAACTGLLATSPTLAGEPPKPLSNAHAHNDYEHGRPLLDALDAGFCSVEADIYLIDGRILVAHDRDKVKPERTLQNLYLDPLKEKVALHGGSVHPGATPPPFSLLIDLKSEGETTYIALHEVLAGYADMLTKFEDGHVRQGAVNVIISGNRPLEMMKNQKLRFAGFDGRLADLEGREPASFMPWISDNFRSHFKWSGEGEMPAEDQKKLADIVKRTHNAGKKLRLWAAPDVPSCWKALNKAGVDVINTDKLTELRTFLLEESP
jgi:hypothetical protein